MSRKLITVIIAIVIYNNIYAQHSDDCKYFQVLTYIKYNAEFSNQLKTYLEFNRTRNKAKCIDINVTPWIEFIEIRQFKDSVIADSVGINKETLSNDRLYYQTYNFEPYKSTLLEKSVSRNGDVSLYLTFSKVVGNTLLVEILNSDNQPHRIRRIGKGVKILFIFDQSGIIKTSLFNRVYYN